MLHPIRQPQKQLHFALSFLIMLGPYVSPWAAMAQSAPTSVGGATNLDLSSSAAALSAGNKSPVNIQMGGSLNGGTVSGGSSMTVSPGQLVTPAQYVAAFSAIQGSNQTLLLNAQGVATGGSWNLSSTSVNNLSSLVVPSGVQLNAIGYNSAVPLNVTGNVNIAGLMHSLQTAPNIMSVLNMGNLNVASGGVLSGHLPSAANLPGLFASAGMQLNVAGNVLNQGLISTPGALSIIASGYISNQSVASVPAMMSA